MSKRRPLFQECGLDRYDRVPCLYCEVKYLAHVVMLHVCKRAPVGRLATDGPSQARRLCRAEWREAIRRAAQSHDLEFNALTPRTAAAHSFVGVLERMKYVAALEERRIARELAEGRAS